MSARKVAIFRSYRKQADEFVGYGFFHGFGQSGNVEDGIGMIAIIERDNGDVQTYDADCIRFFRPTKLAMTEGDPIPGDRPEDRLSGVERERADSSGG